MQISKEQYRTIRILLIISIILVGWYLLSQPPEYCFTHTNPQIHECSSNKTYLEEKYSSYMGLNKLNLSNL
jgi:hypothetical protein